MRATENIVTTDNTILDSTNQVIKLVAMIANGIPLIIPNTNMEKNLESLITFLTKRKFIIFIYLT